MYGVFKLAIPPPIRRVCRTGIIPSQSRRVMFAAIEIVRCEHIVFESGVGGIGCAGGRCG
jgi:hypothetical protein